MPWNVDSALRQALIQNPIEIFGSSEPGFWRSGGLNLIRSARPLIAIPGSRRNAEREAVQGCFDGLWTRCLKRGRAQVDEFGQFRFLAILLHGIAIELGDFLHVALC